MKIVAKNGSTKDHRRIRREMGKALSMHRRLNKRCGANNTALGIADACRRWMYDLANHPGRLRPASV